MATVSTWVIEAGTPAPGGKSDEFRQGTGEGAGRLGVGGKMAV